MKAQEKTRSVSITFLFITHLAALLLGFLCAYFLMSKATVATTSAPQTSAPEIVVQYNPNPCAITFVLAEPIAPDFYVGYGSIGSSYDRYMNDPDSDPMNIGINRAMDLVNQIRHEVPGITEDIYARGYELDVHIAESYLHCKDEIVEQVLFIIAGDYVSHHLAPQPSGHAQGAI